MRSLFIDTATSFLRVGLMDNDQFHLVSYKTNQDHAQHIVEEIDALLKKAQLEPNDIDTIYVVSGPGSFTGLRIGVTIAKVYAYFLNKKLVPVSLLKAQSLVQDSADYYVSIVVDKDKDVYAYIRTKEYKTILDDQYLSIDELNNKLKLLDGQILLICDKAVDLPYPVIPSNFDIKQIMDYYKEHQGLPPHSLKPNYLKKIEVEK